VKTGTTAARELLQATRHCGDPKCECAGIGVVYRVGPASVEELARSGNVYLSIARAVDALELCGRPLRTDEYLGAVVGVWVAPTDNGTRPSLHPEAKEVLMAIVCDGHGEVTAAIEGTTLPDNDADGPLAAVLRGARILVSAV
jgi:hypothetical protein